ncbi:MAG: hypothetical protein JSS53_06210 [Proteobacteria bacterium]|nr:hypothetical protein [Pseudomonadota bacterium]
MSRTTKKLLEALRALDTKNTEAVKSFLDDTFTSFYNEILGNNNSISSPNAIKSNVLNAFKDSLVTEQDISQLDLILKTFGETMNSEAIKLLTVKNTIEVRLFELAQIEKAKELESRVESFKQKMHASNAEIKSIIQTNINRIEETYNETTGDLKQKIETQPIKVKVNAVFSNIAEALEKISNDLNKVSKIEDSRKLATTATYLRNFHFKTPFLDEKTIEALNTIFLFNPLPNLSKDEAKIFGKFIAQEGIFILNLNEGQYHYNPLQKTTDAIEKIQAGEILQLLHKLLGPGFSDQEISNIQNILIALNVNQSSTYEKIMNEMTEDKKPKTAGKSGDLKKDKKFSTTVNYSDLFPNLGTPTITTEFGDFRDLSKALQEHSELNNSISDLNFEINTLSRVNALLKITHSLDEITIHDQPLVNSELQALLRECIAGLLQSTTHDHQQERALDLIEILNLSTQARLLRNNPAWNSVLQQFSKQINLLRVPVEVSNNRLQKEVFKLEVHSMEITADDLLKSLRAMSSKKDIPQFFRDLESFIQANPNNVWLQKWNGSVLNATSISSVLNAPDYEKLTALSEQKEFWKNEYNVLKNIFISESVTKKLARGNPAAEAKTVHSIFNEIAKSNLELFKNTEQKDSLLIQLQKVDSQTKAQEFVTAYLEKAEDYRKKFSDVPNTNPTIIREFFGTLYPADYLKIQLICELFPHDDNSSEAQLISDLGRYIPNPKEITPYTNTDADYPLHHLVQSVRELSEQTIKLSTPDDQLAALYTQGQLERQLDDAGRSIMKTDSDEYAVRLDTFGPAMANMSDIIGKDSTASKISDSSYQQSLAKVGIAIAAVITTVIFLPVVITFLFFKASTSLIYGTPFLGTPEGKAEKLREVVGTTIEDTIKTHAPRLS